MNFRHLSGYKSNTCKMDITFAELIIYFALDFPNHPNISAQYTFVHVHISPPNLNELLSCYKCSTYDMSNIVHCV